MPNMRLALPPQQQQQQRHSATPAPPPSQYPPASLPPPVPAASEQSHTQTVVVENPMTLDENGKLVSNVAVGVTTERR